MTLYAPPPPHRRANGFYRTPVNLTVGLPAGLRRVGLMLPAPIHEPCAGDGALLDGPAAEAGAFTQPFSSKARPRSALPGLNTPSGPRTPSGWRLDFTWIAEPKGNAAHWRTRAYVRHAEDNTRTWFGTRPKAEQETILHDASALLFEDFGGFAVVLANPNGRSDFTSSAGQNKESEISTCLNATAEPYPETLPDLSWRTVTEFTRPFELTPQERSSMADDGSLAAALRYAERGWKIFPVPWGTKKSHKSAEHSGGLKWGMTSDPAEIRRDFKRWPKAASVFQPEWKTGFSSSKPIRPKATRSTAWRG